MLIKLAACIVTVYQEVSCQLKSVVHQDSCLLATFLAHYLFGTILGNSTEVTFSMVTQSLQWKIYKQQRMIKNLIWINLHTRAQILFLSKLNCRKFLIKGFYSSCTHWFYKIIFHFGYAPEPSVSLTSPSVISCWPELPGLIGLKRVKSHDQKN